MPFRIDLGTPKRYRVVCKCKYFALNTLSGTKIQDFNPKSYDEHPRPFYMGFPPPGGRLAHNSGKVAFENIKQKAREH